MDILKNKKVLWVMFGLFLWSLLMYIFDGSGGGSMYESGDFFSLSILVASFLLSVFYIFKVLRICPWKKGFQQELFAGFYLLLYFLWFFFDGPYFSMGQLLRIVFVNGIDNVFYLFIHFDNLLFLVWWLSGSTIILFSSLLYLGFLKAPSITFSVPKFIQPSTSQQKIGLIQIFFALFILISTFIAPSSERFDFEIYVDFIKEMVEEQDSSQYQETPQAFFAEKLAFGTYYATNSMYQSLFNLGCVILFVLAAILLLQGLVNVQSRE